MKACITLVTVCLIVSLSILALPVKAQAQEPLNLTIKPDGSIEPNTDFTWLQKNESTYTLVVDIFGTITVQRAGITIDGAGHTLQGNQTVNVRGINLVGHDETFNAYGNVLVKNLRIYNFLEGIYTPSNNNSFIGNRFENAGIHILGGSGEGDLVKHNTFVNARVFVDYNHGGLDVITENNFFNSGTLVDLADAPYVDRNYWSNYTTVYPNATEVDGSGVWDTPYIDEVSWATNRSIDYHPLVNPITDFEIPAFGIPPPSATPTFSQHPTINTGAEPPQTEPFPTSTILVATLILLAVVVASVLLFRRHRKTANLKR
jgi:hypothetical protein